VVAACERSLPLFVPGWEDSTLGSIFSSLCLRGTLSSAAVRNGIDYLLELAAWYRRESAEHAVGLFQIGGGIAGDFAICVVPMMRQDLGEEVPLWHYFCQISDSTTSYGSYSGAVPNEKITWGKLAVDSPQFVIESDATIVAPLIFAYLLGW
jgi:deoxyhypusine synthase